MSKKLIIKNKIKIKKGDEVIVTVGKNKGKLGKILKVIPKNNKVIVSGINLAKKHMKPDNKQAGGITEKEMPMHISNVSFYDKGLKKGIKIGYSFLKDGSKVRIKKKNEGRVGVMTRLLKLYNEEIHPMLNSKFNYKNKYQAPKITKIVLNMGIGEGKDDSKLVDKAQDELTLIAGQKAMLTKAKKAIANFKIRDGMKIGTKVTLRNKRMYEFLDRLINLALSRIKDFRGLSVKSFDGKGNFSMGIQEQIIFHEIDYDKVDKIKGLNIIICTNAKTDSEALELLKGFNMPFATK